MRSLALRPRSATELLDAAFQVLRLHYAPIALATLVIVLPAVVLRLVLPASLAALPDLLSNLLLLAASAATVVIVADAYLGRPVSVGRALRAVGSRFGSVFGASVIQGILIGLGLLLLVVPGVIAFAWTFAMPMAVMVEGCRASESFGRSRALARGHVGRVLLTLGLAYLIFFVALIGAALALEGALGVAGSGDRLSDVLAELAAALVYPFVSVVATLLYFDLRIRTEAFDLELVARELSGDPAEVA